MRNKYKLASFRNIRNLSRTITLHAIIALVALTYVASPSTSHFGQDNLWNTDLSLRYNFKDKPPRTHADSFTGVGSPDGGINFFNYADTDQGRVVNVGANSFCGSSTSHRRFLGVLYKGNSCYFEFQLYAKSATSKDVVIELQANLSRKYKVPSNENGKELIVAFRWDNFVAFPDRDISRRRPPVTYEPPEFQGGLRSRLAITNITRNNSTVDLIALADQNKPYPAGRKPWEQIRIFQSYGPGSGNKIGKGNLINLRFELSLKYTSRAIPHNFHSYDPNKVEGMLGAIEIIFYERQE